MLYNLERQLKGKICPKIGTNWQYCQCKTGAMQNIFIIFTKWRVDQIKNQSVGNCQKSTFEEIPSLVRMLSISLTSCGDAPAPPENISSKSQGLSKFINLT